MKTVVVLTLLLALVTGIGANGSRAQALAATSVAFEQCQGAGRSSACQPLPRPLLAQTEAELAGADRAAGAVAAAGAGADAGAEVGESRAYALAVFFNVPTFFLELTRYFLRGSLYPSPLIVAETVFDPVR